MLYKTIIMYNLSRRSLLNICVFRGVGVYVGGGYGPVTSLTDCSRSGAAVYVLLVRSPAEQQISIAHPKPLCASGTQ